MPSIANKLLRKKERKHFSRTFQKTKSTQTNSKVFAQRDEQVKGTKIELDFSKIQMAITAIISLRIMKKPTNKQAAPVILPRQVANSSNYFLTVANFLQKPERKSDFESKVSQRVSS